MDEKMLKSRTVRLAAAIRRSAQVRKECNAANAANPETRQQRRRRERALKDDYRVGKRRKASNARHHALKERQQRRELSGFYTGLSVATALMAVGRRRRRVKKDELGKNRGNNLVRLG